MRLKTLPRCGANAAAPHQPPKRFYPYEVNAVIPAGYAKVKDKYRFQFLVRAPTILTINDAIKTVQQHCVLPKEIKVRIDIESYFYIFLIAFLYST